jgi:tRNA(Phe) wybutosine-synthesizing methylase Tyw3
MLKMLRDADENKASDEMFKQVNNLREWLTTLKIQLLELIDTKVLSQDEIAELEDLKVSIETDYLSENIELLNGLVQSGKELVQELSQKVYDESKKVMK